MTSIRADVKCIYRISETDHLFAIVKYNSDISSVICGVIYKDDKHMELVNDFSINYGSTQFCKVGDRIIMLNSFSPANPISSEISSIKKLISLFVIRTYINMSVEPHETRTHTIDNTLKIPKKHLGIRPSITRTYTFGNTSDIKPKPDLMSEEPYEDTDTSYGPDEYECVKPKDSVDLENNLEHLLHVFENTVRSKSVEQTSEGNNTETNHKDRIIRQAKERMEKYTNMTEKQREQQIQQKLESCCNSGTYDGMYKNENTVELNSDERMLAEKNNETKHKDQCNGGMKIVDNIRTYEC